MTFSFSTPSIDPNPERGGIFFKLIFFLFLIGLFSILYIFRDPLLRMAGNFWVVDERPQASDAIVILGDDDYNADRAARAAELFKAGVAPEVVASGRFLRPYASVAELERHDLADRGVSAGSVILLAHHAENTRAMKRWQ